MSDDPPAHGCDEYAGNLAELALGILTGRERAATLAHVESCPRCADELEQLSRAADAVVRVAPEIEPPVGFEVSLFSRMGVSEVQPRRRTFGVPRWALAAAAAAVALVVGLSVGWMTGSPTKNPTSNAEQVAPAGKPIAAASLVENGVDVGHVFTYGGKTPWMFMTLADSAAHGRVICEVVTTDGVVHKVGSFTAKDGYGAWGAPLPVSPQAVRSAEVVSSNGAVIATAALA